jgi:hypothetical protein
MPRSEGYEVGITMDTQIIEGLPDLEASDGLAAGRLVAAAQAAHHFLKVRII